MAKPSTRSSRNARSGRGSPVDPLGSGKVRWGWAWPGGGGRGQGSLAAGRPEWRGGNRAAPGERTARAWLLASRQVRKSSLWCGGSQSLFFQGLHTSGIFHHLWLGALDSSSFCSQATEVNFCSNEAALTSLL